MAGRMQLVTAVVQRKDGKKASKAAIAAGASGVTSFYARGTGVRQRLGLLGRLIQAEKEVLLVAVPRGRASAILEALTEAVGLDQPGKGFAWVQELEQVVTWLPPEDDDASSPD